MYCKNCGMKMENGAKFCGRCGMPVDNEIFEIGLPQSHWLLPFCLQSDIGISERNIREREKVS